MTDLSKNTKPRWGSDWDLDLGWVLLWLLFALTIMGIVTALSYASVQNNRGNVGRDQYYAEHCKVIFVAQNSGQAYQCQNK